MTQFLSTFSGLASRVVSLVEGKVPDITRGEYKEKVNHCLFSQIGRVETWIKLSYALTELRDLCKNEHYNYTVAQGSQLSQTVREVLGEASVLVETFRECWESDKKKDIFDAMRDSLAALYNAEEVLRKTKT